MSLLLGIPGQGLLLSETTCLQAYEAHDEQLRQMLLELNTGLQETMLKIGTPDRLSEEVCIYSCQQHMFM